MHDNFVERQIKQYALAKKVWIFRYDNFGAEANANLFTLVMTARANGLKPFAYLARSSSGCLLQQRWKRSRRPCRGISNQS
jgi:hypothetical protein